MGTEKTRMLNKKQEEKQKLYQRVRSKETRLKKNTKKECQSMTEEAVLDDRVREHGKRRGKYRQDTSKTRKKRAASGALLKDRYKKEWNMRGKTEKEKMKQTRKQPRGNVVMRPKEEREERERAGREKEKGKRRNGDQ